MKFPNEIPLIPTWLFPTLRVNYRGGDWSASMANG
jgi:hypothetical protein